MVPTVDQQASIRASPARFIAFVGSKATCTPFSSIPNPIGTTALEKLGSVVRKTGNPEITRWSTPGRSVVTVVISVLLTTRPRQSFVQTYTHLIEVRKMKSRLFSLVLFTTMSILTSGAQRSDLSGKVAFVSVTTAKVVSTNEPLDEFAPNVLLRFAKSGRSSGFLAMTGKYGTTLLPIEGRVLRRCVWTRRA